MTGGGAGAGVGVGVDADVGAGVGGGTKLGAVTLRNARICCTSSPDTSILLITIVLVVLARPRLSTVIRCWRAVIVWIILQLSQYWCISAIQWLSLSPSAARSANRC